MIERDITREEHAEVDKLLRSENEKLKAQLEEARLAVEHNRHVAEENLLKYKLYYRDGVIYGMKYALRCNGVSGGEIDRYDRSMIQSAERKKGRWIKRDKNLFPFGTCSECGSISVEADRANFCPNCGARMEEE